MIELDTPIDDAYADSDVIGQNLHILELDCVHVQYHKEFNNAHGCVTVRDTLEALAEYPDPRIFAMLVYILVYPEYEQMYSAEVRQAYLDMCFSHQYSRQFLLYVFGSTLPESYQGIIPDKGMQEMFDNNIQFDYTSLQREYLP